MKDYKNNVIIYTVEETNDKMLKPVSREYYRVQGKKSDIGVRRVGDIWSHQVFSCKL